MKASGGAKRNASIEQGTQISTATQGAATTTRYRHTNKLSGNTSPTCIRTMASQEGGKGRGKLPHKCTNTSSKMHHLQSKYASSNANRRPICWMGAHDPWTPLTGIGSILTWPKLQPHLFCFGFISLLLGHFIFGLGLGCMNSTFSYIIFCFNGRKWRTLKEYTWRKGEWVFIVFYAACQCS